MSTQPIQHDHPERRGSDTYFSMRPIGAFPRPRNAPARKVLEIPCRYCGATRIVTRKDHNICFAKECREKQKTELRERSLANARGRYKSETREFPYTCLWCKADFPNGVKSDQNCCGAANCIQARWTDYNKKAVEKRRLARESAPKIEKVEDEGRILTDAKANAIWQEKYGDAEDAYYNAGLTPTQQRKRKAERLAAFELLVQKLRAKGEMA